MRNIVVVPYDPAWPEMFEAESAKIAGVFGRELVAIHHIGSTSVSGLSAKPIIDIMPVVRDIERVAELNRPWSGWDMSPEGNMAFRAGVISSRVAMKIALTMSIRSG